MRDLPPFPAMRDFLDWCAGHDALLRVPDPVPIRHRMTQVHRLALERGGPVLRFDHPVDANGLRVPMPVIANLFGTADRVAAGLGVAPERVAELGAFLAALRAPTPPSGARDALARWPMLRAALAARPKIVAHAPVQTEARLSADVDLSTIPVQTHWPGDAGPLITWPLVITRQRGSAVADVGAYNAGVYRAQAIGRDRLILRWLAHRGGAAHHRSWVRAGEDAPVAIALGADPASLLSAALPLPEGVSELAFAGALNGRRTRMTPALTQPIMVPADAEIVIEGRALATETAPEGPFGDHTGYYNPAAPYPVMQVTAITHRFDPLYLSTYTGRPPDEPSIIGGVFNRLALPMICAQIPEIRALHLPPAACSYRIAVASIDKRYPGQARRVMLALWGMLPQFSYTKIIVVVDDDVDPADWDDVAWALATRMDPARDVEILSRTPMDELDFASAQPGLSGKMGIDATTKIGAETARDWGEVMHADPADRAFAEALLARRIPAAARRREIPA